MKAKIKVKNSRINKDQFDINDYEQFEAEEALKIIFWGWMRNCIDLTFYSWWNTGGEEFWKIFTIC